MDRSLIPPSPFQRGPAPGAMAQTRMHPTELLEAMRRIAPQPVSTTPHYPANFTPPPRPDKDKVIQQAKHLWEQYDHWRTLIEITWEWINHRRTGMFPEDEADRAAGLQEEYISNALSRKRNAAIARIASSKIGVRKRYNADNLRRSAQRLEDAAMWVLEQMEAVHAAAGNRPMKLDEALLLVDRGMFVSRQVLDPGDPDLPLCVDLIEPTQVMPIFGGKRGLTHVYRYYRDTIENIVAAYGDFTPTARKKIAAKFGTDLTERTELEVYEYWDAWWRFVAVDDELVVPVAAHEYGYVPWTVQYGGYGDAMFTRTPGDRAYRSSSGAFVQVDTTRRDERIFKAVPLIYYDVHGHSIYEAVMARILTGFKKEINPTVNLYRDMMVAGTDRPEYSNAAGAINEFALGQERAELAPQQSNNPITGMLIQGLLSEAAKTDPTMGSAMDKTNQATGAALLRVGDENSEQLVPLYQALERAKSHQLSQIFQTIGNFGHLAKYGNTRVSPLMVPARKTRQGEAPAFELGRELIDAVGPRVEVTFTKVSPADWVGLFNAGKLGIEIGAVGPDEIRALATGDHDYDRFLEEWIEYRAIMSATQHPKFNELFHIPMMIEEQITESMGDPERVAFWKKQLQAWMQMAMQSQAQPGGGDPMAAMGGQAPQATPGNPSPPPPGSVVLPPTQNGQSMPALGLGPGNQGGAVGRPPGM